MSAEILLVEDNEQNMELASYLLAEAGFVVRQASNAEQARAEVRRAAPALVLLDMNLAGHDGLALVEEWRRDPRLSGLRILAVTAHAMRGDRERFLAAGCDGYIAKPIEVRTFAQAVLNHCPAGGTP